MERNRLSVVLAIVAISCSLISLIAQSVSRELRLKQATARVAALEAQVAELRTHHEGGKR